MDPVSFIPFIVAATKIVSEIIIALKRGKFEIKLLDNHLRRLVNHGRTVRCARIALRQDTLSDPIKLGLTIQLEASIWRAIISFGNHPAVVSRDKYFQSHRSEGEKDLRGTVGGKLGRFRGMMAWSMSRKSEVREIFEEFRRDWEALEGQQEMYDFCMNQGHGGGRKRGTGGRKRRTGANERGGEGQEEKGEGSTHDFVMGMVDDGGLADMIEGGMKVLGIGA